MQTTSLKSSIRSTPWWKAPSKEVGALVTATFDAIEQTTTNKERMNKRALHRALFNAESFTPGFTDSSEELAKALDAFFARESYTINVCKSVVETACARVASRQRPKPVFLSTGASWSQRDRTTRANRYMEGVFRDAKVSNLATAAFRDAEIDGIGGLFVCVQDGRVVIEKVDTQDIMVDPVEGRREKPRSVYLTRIMDRQVLLSMLQDDDEHEKKGKPEEEASEVEEPESEEVKEERRALTRAARKAIIEANFTLRDSDPTEYHDSPSCDPVRIVEAWRLGSCHGAEDGRHVIAIGDAVLLDEKKRIDRFPLVFVRWASADEGFFGVGLVESIADIQLEITSTMSKVRETIDLLGASKVYMPEHAAVDAKQHTNEIGEIIGYRGDTPPTVVAPNPVSPALFEWLDRNVAWAYDIAGVSRLQATSQKPAGLQSGEALREYNDTGDDRLTTVAVAFETLHLDLAHVIVDLLAEHPEHEIYMSRSKSMLQRVKWSDVMQDRDDYVLAMHPTSQLSRDFGTRKQQLGELVQAGIMTNEDMMRLLELPDLDEETDLRNAPKSLADMHIESILRDYVYVEPEPIQDLVYTKQRCSFFLAREQAMGVSLDDPGLDLLRTYTQRVTQMLAEAEQAMQPPPQPTAPMPQPADMAPMMPAPA